MIALISRGVAITECVSHVTRAATMRSKTFELITGMPLPKAQQFAVNRARELGEGLIIVEDDITADDLVWDAAIETLGTDYVGTVEANIYNHGSNLIKRLDGSILSAGAPLIAIPSILWNILPEKLFAPANITVDDDKLTYRTPNKDGMHSDTYFYWVLQEHGVKVKLLGDVKHWYAPGWVEKQRYTEPSFTFSI